MDFKKIVASLLILLPIATGALNASSIYWPAEFRELEQTIFGNDCSSTIDTIRTVRIGYKTFTVKAKQRVRKVLIKINLGFDSYDYQAERKIKILENNRTYRSTVTGPLIHEKIQPRPTTQETKEALEIAGDVFTLFGAAIRLISKTF